MMLIVKYCIGLLIWCFMFVIGLYPGPGTLDDYFNSLILASIYTMPPGIVAITVTHYCKDNESLQ